MTGNPRPLADQLTPTGAGLAEDLDWIASMLDTPDTPTPTDAPDRRTDEETPHATPPQTATPSPTDATDAIPGREPSMPAPVPPMPHAGTAPVAASSRPVTAPPLPAATPARTVPRTTTTPPPLPSGTREPAYVVDKDDPDDPAGLLETVADPEPAARPNRRRRAILLAVAGVLCAAMLATVITWAAGAHRARTAETRLDQTVASLSAADTKATQARRKAIAAGVDAKETTPLTRRISLDRKLIAQADTPMDTGSAERLARSLTSAEQQTTRLTSRLERATRTRLTAAAKARCRTALDKAEQAMRDTAGLTGDQTVRAAAGSLDTAIKAAGGLGAKTTASQWDSMAARLDKARDTLTKAADAKRAANKAAEAKAQAEAQAEAEAKAQAEAEAAAKSQADTQAQTTPTPTTPKRQASTPRATANPKPSGGQSTGQAPTWSVPSTGTDTGLPATDPGL
ncbi:hypothetical protein ACLUWU_07190 [Bifidobacterium thermophilum]|uniref:hypothetical protein n=1 Tax=Bifidobacterium thermophilum TaxID=33905 RepID=UPI00399265C2